MRITLEHLSGPGFCRRGARAWFARYGLDWAAFRRQGIDAQTMLATGDALAVALVQHAKEKERSRGR